ncbi:MAG TPA: hypothetical protein VIW03_01285, partial [Anaeromyxobacter sp.]
MARKRRAPARARKSGQRLDQGRKKVRPPGTPEARFSSHKRRAGWFASRAAWPLREPPIARLVSERTRARTT